MTKPRSQPESPACYAIVLPGLETLAAAEIAERLDADVKRTAGELVVFRPPVIDKSLLSLRTTEDVYLLAWGTDQLTYRAVDLDSIRRWTDRDADWEQLLRLHHTIRPKPKGKPTFRLVVQMAGKHGYRRVDARKALAEGLAGHLPASWRHAEENASIEIWLTIHGATATCGVRLSDRSMRHRTYKFEHLPASLRPTLAAAMVRVAELRPGQTVLDPMCGAGTILAEVLSQAREVERQRRWQPDAVAAEAQSVYTVLGGDIDRSAVRAAGVNLARMGQIKLETWDARTLPVAGDSVDRIICNLPFGVKIEKPEDVPRLMQKALPEFHRVLKPGGRAILLVGDPAPLKDAIVRLPWKQLAFYRVRILGQKAHLFAFRKGE
jgi:tRNA (guanine6-N2)-methyltransferase